MRTGFSANLDFLRAFAVMLVLAQHLLRRNYVDYIGWIPSSSLGWFGVLLFFVHTTLVLMESLERQQGGTFGSFYIRRFFRIYPLSILAVAGACLLHLDSDVNGIRGLSYGARPGFVTLVSNFLLTQNLVGAKSIVNVLWSLPYEVQMYVFLPLVFMLARRGKLWFLLGIWVCALPLAILASGSGQRWVNLISLLQFVPNFLPGAVAFVLLPRATAKFANWLWPIFILSLLLAFTIFPRNLSGWLLCLALGVAAPYFAEIRNPALNWFSNRIATYSYGIYVSHQFAIWFCFGVLGQYSKWVRISLLVSLLAGVPALLFHCIELPMIRLGKKFAANFPGRKPAFELAA